MKISNSKKQLAKIISENGGWREGAEFAAQDPVGGVFFFSSTPKMRDDVEEWDYSACLRRGHFKGPRRLNWHQTILSRDEYFHLYPAQDADVPSGDGVTDDTAALQRILDCSRRAATIEQLAADYKAKLAIAQQAQEEADSRRSEVEAALEKLYQAGIEIGLDIAIASKEDEDEGEPELVITDWRQWQVGDCISWSIISTPVEYKIISVHHDEHREIGDFEIMDGNGNVFRCYGDECKFIRRP